MRKPSLPGLIVIAAIIIGILSLALVIVGPRGNPPTLEVGAVPEEYVLDDVVEDGADVDLGEVGAARLAGTVSSDTIDVIVEGLGGETHATIDRTSNPPVWWVLAAPDKDGTETFTVRAIGADGSEATERISVDFTLPDPEDTIIHPDVLVLGDDDAPTLTSWDRGSGVATLTGAKLGQVRLGTVLVSEGTEDVDPDGMFASVTGMVGDSELSSLVADR